MDATTIIFPLLQQYWWFPVVLLLLGLFKSPLFKGYFGELLVRLLLGISLDKRTYLCLHNVTVPTLDGTTQIDHILLSPFGVFVIETKNMRGWIFGSAAQENWTQKIFRNSYKFQNPLRQNFKHLKALEQLLGIPLDKIHSAIVFVGDSAFKTPMPANVTFASGLTTYIRSFSEVVFTAAQIQTLLQALQEGRRAPTFASHRQHVKNLENRGDINASRLCPKCGSALVIRTVKSGKTAGHQFWGCSTYPKCRLIQDVA